MAERISKRELNSRFFVIDAGHIENLLSREQRDYYTTRVEGWGCDIYVFGNPLDDHYASVALAVGYDTITRKGVTQRVWDLSRKYDDKARALLSKTRYNMKKYNYVTTILRRWIIQFIKEVLTERR